MTRYMTLKTFLKKVYSEDILIFTGNGLSQEAYNFDAENHFYFLDNFGVSIPFALGLAMCIERRVFVFVGEGDLIRNLGSMVQVAASKCKNMFVVVLNNDCYEEVGGYPNVFQNIRNFRGLLADLGMLMFDFTSQMDSRHPLDALADNVDRLVGPSAVLIKVSNSNKKYKKEIDLSPEEITNRLEKNIYDGIQSKLYNPPDVDELNVNGGIVNGL